MHTVEPTPTLMPDLFAPQSQRTSVTKFLTVGENRGAGRLWIEGSLPDYKTPYSRVVDAQAGTVTLHFWSTTTEGRQLHISRKNHGGIEVPVIDLCGQYVDSVFTRGGRVVCEIFTDRVVIRQSEVEKARAEREAAFISGQPLSHGSFFSGFGALDLSLANGFSDSGALMDPHLSFVSELDAATTTILTKNNPLVGPTTAVYQGDMRRLDDVDLPRVDIAAGGFPCVAFSRAAKSSKGLVVPEEDKRAGAIPHYLLKQLARANPAIICLENVPEVLSSVSKLTIDAVLDDLGYVSQVFELNGADFPTVENRNRVCLLYVSKGLAERVDAFGIVGATIEAAKCANTQSIADLMDQDVPESEWKTTENLEAREAKAQARGNGFKRQLFAPDSTHINTLRAGLARVATTDPRIVREDGKSRLPTVAEHAKFKGIPVSLVAGVTSKSLGHRVLGNSILAPAFEAVGRGIGQLWLALQQKQ